MTNDRVDLDARVRALLDDPQYAGHPLRAALSDLRDTMAQQLVRIEKISALSDGFQRMARDRELSMVGRFDRQLRRLSKIVSISDRYQDALRDQNRAVVDASNRDTLTELLNRRGLTERLRQYCAYAAQQQRGFCLAMLDVDHFKRVNDAYGHETGDRALIALGQVMSMELGDSDFCGRWGGEEFLVVLSTDSLSEAHSTLTRLLDAVRDLRVPLAEDTMSITASMGIALHRPGESISLTLNRADIALYDAKRAGRNLVRDERAGS